MNWQKKFFTFIGVCAYCTVIATSAAEVAADDDELLRIRQVISDTQAAILRDKAEILNERATLLAAENVYRAADVRPNALEAARLELAERRAQLDNLQTRLETRQEALRQNDNDLLELRNTLRDLRAQTDTDSDTRRTQLQKEQAEKRERQQALNELIGGLKALRGQARIKVSLAQQQLLLLQSRFELPPLDQLSQSNSPQYRQLQRKIDQLLTQATKLRHAASQAKNGKKRLLSTQALNAEEMADLRQLDLSLLQIEQILRVLDTFTQTPSTPLRILRQGRESISKISVKLATEIELLDKKTQILKERRQIIADQQAVVGADEVTSLTAQLQLFDSLLSETQQRGTAINHMQAAMENARQRFNRALSTTSQRDLFVQSELPDDSASWLALGNNLLNLPLRVIHNISNAVQNMFASVVDAPPSQKIILALVTALWLVLAISLRWWAARLLARENTKLIKGLAKLLRKNVFGLMPAVVLVSVDLILQLPLLDTYLLLIILLIWPGVRIALSLAALLLLDVPEDINPVRQAFYVKLRWVLILGGVLVSALVIAHAVALSPVVRDVIDRGSMLCLLLIAIPTLHLRSMLLHWQNTAVAEMRFTLKVAAYASLLVPAIAVVFAVIGMLGYVNLAWAIASHLGWLVLIASGLLLLMAVLNDGMDVVQNRLQARSESAAFAGQYVLSPMYRLGRLGLIIVAGVVLFYVYDWNAQTPVIGQIPSWLDMTIFQLGQSPLKLRDLIAAVVIFMLVFWFGRWSRQVSYRWAYTKVTDAGIRNSLATFTQYIVIVIGLLIVMRTVGLDLTALTVFAGAVGIGVGFGMQTIIVNFISGILLLVERPLRAGDIVNVDQYEGEVTQIGIRALTIKTWDSQDVIIPNSSVITKPFINWTRGDDVMRTVLTVGVSYDGDPNQALQAVSEILTEHPAVLSTPPIKVLLWDFAESSLTVRVQFHTHIRGDIGRSDVRSQILLAIWARFKALGIEIPYPQRDLHIKHSPVPVETVLSGS